MRKKDIEIMLSSLEDVEKPKPSLEQYMTPVDIAVELVLYAYQSGDIKDRRVADLGSGNGILSFASHLLGSSEVIGYDKDHSCVIVAKENFRILKEHPKYEPIGGDVRFIRANVDDDGLEWEKVDTVIMNPPFGAQKKGADRPFISRSLKISQMVYSIHNWKGREFVKKEYERMGGEVQSEKCYIMRLGSRFKFHTRKNVDLKVALFKVRSVDR